MIELPESSGVLMPPTTRKMWASTEAREQWEGRFSELAAAWHEITWQTVRLGLRDLALLLCGEGTAIRHSERAIRQNLSVLPIKDGLLVARSKTPLLAGLATATGGAGDIKGAGELFGYPECCVEAFDDAWGQRHHCQTWPQAIRSDDHEGGNVIHINHYAPETNLMWRRWGLRCLPFFPCSFNCAKAVEQAETIYGAAAREAGLGGEFEEILEILGWSLNWSSLHGIAEISTPVAKWIQDTVPYNEERQVKLYGTLPEWSAPGIGFPFVIKAPKQLTTTTSFEQSTEIAELTGREMEDLPTPPPFLPGPNGFPTYLKMETAHRFVVEAAKGSKQTAVFDLGCGDGALAHTVGQTIGAEAVGGIDRSAFFVETANSRDGDGWIAGDIFMLDEIPPALVILMPGRLTEVDEACRSGLLRRLAGREVLVYAYRDWLQHKPLKEMCEEGGLGWRRVGPVIQESAAHATRLLVGDD